MIKRRHVFAKLVVGFLFVALLSVAVYWYFTASGSYPGTPIKGDIPLEYNEEFEESVFSALTGEPEVPLRSLTDFNWTSVSIFHNGDSPAWVQEQTGVDLLGSQYNITEAFLVFCSNDSVIAMFQYSYENMASPQTTYSAGATFIDGELVEPSEDSVQADCAPLSSEVGVMRG